MHFKPACQQAHLFLILIHRDSEPQSNGGDESVVADRWPSSSPLRLPTQRCRRCGWCQLFRVRTSRNAESGQKFADLPERSRLLPRNLSGKMTRGHGPFRQPTTACRVLSRTPMQLFRHQLRRMFEPSRMRGAAIFVLFTTGWIVVALSSVQTSPKREEAEAARLRSLRSTTTRTARRAADAPASADRHDASRGAGGPRQVLHHLP